MRALAAQVDLGFPRGIQARLDEIEALEADHARAPEHRAAQRALALDVTRRVHGPAEAARAVRVSEAAFSDQPVEDPDLLEALYQALDHFEFGLDSLLDGLERRLANG